MDLYIGIEGGCVYVEKNFCFRLGFNRRSIWLCWFWEDVYVPTSKKNTKLIDKGVELGEADDLVFKRNDSKKKRCCGNIDKQSNRQNKIL